VAAAAVRRVFFGPVAIAIEAVGIAALVWLELALPPAVDFGVAVVLLAFTLHAVHRFLVSSLEARSSALRTHADPAALLDAEVARFLPDPFRVSSGDLLRAAARSPRGAFVLQEAGIESSAIEKLASESDALDARTCLQGTAVLLPQWRVTAIGAPQILGYFLRQEDAARQILNDLDLSVEHLDSIIRWEAFHERERRGESALSPARLLQSFGGMERSWIMGFNSVLDRLTEDCTQQALREGPTHVVLHGDQITALRSVLTRSTLHNAILLGRSGSGRRTLIRNFAAMLRTEELKAGTALSRVLQLKTQQLLSGTEHPDADLLHALERTDAGRYVMVVRELPLMLTGGDARLEGVLLKLLESRNVSVIAIADPQEYHSVVAAKPSVDRLFERILIEECSEAEALAVLMEEYFSLRRRYRLTVTYRALLAIVELTTRYVGDAALPGKAAEVLREVIAAAASSGQRTVDENDVRRVVSLRAHQDVTTLQGAERDTLLHLEEHMGKRIVGQPEAVGAIAAALKRGKLELGSRSKPLATFLLLGPTGVGKTESAKALATLVFGAEDRMIRLDMNEFSEAASVAAVIGGGPADRGVLTQKIQERPHSLILLDELEKAHLHVLNLFLQILDEGHLLDSDGVKTDFRSTIIVATSNAGAGAIQEIIRASPKQNAMNFKSALLDAIIRQGAFSPEFLNRFDEVVVFLPLLRDAAVRIAILMIDALVTKLRADKGIELTLDSGAVEAIAAKGFSPAFGARAMRRAIQDTLEAHLADRFLKTPPKRGDRITVTRGDLKI
jgi:ATP-dependent Clp protease ATP-binding subunit ClpC